MADSNVPSIRFKGFTDPWEQRKLSEYLTLSRIIGHTGVDANKLTVKLWGKGVVAKTDSYGGSRNTQYYVRHAGQFMYGKLDFLHAAFGIVPEELDGYESTLDSPAFDMSGVDGVFLLNRVTQEDFYLGNGLIANGSRKAKRIHEDTFLDMSLTMPSLAEQQVIGRFFSRLDSLITLHQRKYDKLVVLKKSMLEQMFPQEGESVPRIRFSGFTDPWEQRKLGELEKKSVLRMGRGNVISAKDMTAAPGSFPVYSSSALDNGQMGSYGKYMFDQELVTWSIDGGGAVFYRKKHKFSVTNVSGYIATDPDKMSCAFLAQSMSLAHSCINFDYTVKAHPSVIRSLYTLGIPSLAEQQIIGRFFSRLDSLITLHQRKLELLQNIKKSLLEQMFV
ncbi:type I restriction-modification system, subunit S [Bifidobacterium goeldii]|uniref:Type I restriction-modification system, subunit S n=1 Tax=Bifidobacterium goeldii TaxID=2306975 RepID=A0A430FK51_9BIFI|nr:restriction endonuclease subunit S [Bifidobacterium goeldii]RSX53216.1 type I restriction-modification system, subunit S [Bifidobacterium goeldii]